MNPKHLPRLWCALQGLLPFEACVAAQRGELAWPREPGEPEDAGAIAPRVARRRGASVTPTRSTPAVSGRN